MPLKTLTKLLVAFFFILGSSSAIDIDGTCNSGGACVGGMTDKAAVAWRNVLTRVADMRNAEQPNEDTSALFQSKKAEVLAARGLQKKDPKIAADQIEASTPLRMQKMMEIKTAVRDIKDLIGAVATPEITGLIQQMITIVKDIQMHIAEDQNDARQELYRRFANLHNMTKIALSLKAGVDTSVSNYDGCVTDEKSSFDAYVKCQSEENSIEPEPTPDYCAHPDLNISYSDPPQLPKTLTVDFKEGLTNVQQELDRYLLPLTEWLDATKTKAKGDQDKWDTADMRCKAKIKENKDKKRECTERLTTWRNKHEACMEVLNEQKLALCEFGRAYHNKCAAKLELDLLKADIAGNGTVWSESDREHEWTETTKLTCVLAKFNTTTKLSTGALEDCTKSIDKAEFDRDVTLIDTKQAFYDELVSEANLTCAETNFTFGGGVLWTVPVNRHSVVDWIPNSTDYARMTSHVHSIDLESRVPPYDIHCMWPDPASCKNGEWHDGFGEGGTEEMLDTVSSYNECFRMVEDRCSNASGASVSKGGIGACFCERGMTSYNSDLLWQTCVFNKA